MKRTSIEGAELILKWWQRQSKDAYTHLMIHPNYCVEQYTQSQIYCFLFGFSFRNLDEYSSWNKETTPNALGSYASYIVRIQSFEERSQSHRVRSKWMSPFVCIWSSRCTDCYQQWDKIFSKVNNRKKTTLSNFFFVCWHFSGFGLKIRFTCFYLAFQSMSIDIYLSFRFFFPRIYLVVWLEWNVVFPYVHTSRFCLY